MFTVSQLLKSAKVGYDKGPVLELSQKHRSWRWTMKVLIGLFALFSFSICCSAQNMGGHHHTVSGAASEAAATSEMQDWAKERLAKSSRHQEWVKVKNGTREVSSFVVYPEVKNKATAVVVIHEIFGMSPWVQSLTDQLAEAGYIAIAPDLLSGMGPKGGGTEEIAATGNNAVGQAIRDLPPDQITADLNAVADYVANRLAHRVIARRCY